MEEIDLAHSQEDPAKAAMLAALMGLTPEHPFAYEILAARVREGFFEVIPAKGALNKLVDELLSALHGENHAR
jgi:hypothetical protein